MKKANKLSKVYVLGNPLLKEDSLPLKFLPSLKQNFPNIEFIHLNPAEDFPEEDNLTFLDTILNTNKVVILTEKDIDRFQSPPNYSLHDFDLATNLKLLIKLKLIKQFTIIGVPPDISEEKALDELREIITSFNDL